MSNHSGKFHIDPSTDPKYWFWRFEWGDQASGIKSCTSDQRYFTTKVDAITSAQEAWAAMKNTPRPTIKYKVGKLGVRRRKPVK